MKLTSKFFYFIVLIIGCLWAMHTKLRPFPYVVLLFLIITPLVSILFVWLQKQTIKTSTKVLPLFVKQNQELIQTFSIHNISRLWPTTIQYQQKETLKPSEKQHYQQSLDTNHVGPINNKTISLKVFDTLDLVSVNHSLHPTSNSYVLPEVKDFQLENLPTSDLVNHFKQLLVSTSQDALEGVRSYQKGDSLKKIHWPISSKYTQFFSRVDETSPKPLIHCEVLPNSLDKPSHENLNNRDEFMHFCLSIMDQLLDQSLELTIDSKPINHSVMAAESLAQIPIKHNKSLPAITQPTLLFKQQLTPNDLLQLEPFHREVVLIIFEEPDRPNHDLLSLL